jgi:hypothetical protein
LSGQNYQTVISTASGYRAPDQHFTDGQTNARKCHAPLIATGACRDAATIEKRSTMGADQERGDEGYSAAS